MPNSISKDLQTLIEYVNMKDNSVKEELSEQLYSIRNVLTEEVRNYLYEEIKQDPEFRGPIGYTGSDGDAGSMGSQGPRGNTPRIQIDEDNKKVTLLISGFPSGELKTWNKVAASAGNKTTNPEDTALSLSSQSQNFWYSDAIR